jgi:hypothetical protein
VADALATANLTLAALIRLAMQDADPDVRAWLAALVADDDAAGEVAAYVQNEAEPAEVPT